ncbi:hypothetical protein [Paraburkholderia sp. Ac-20347]|uniref:hypothetical protein n=1 Tax=Paraburkholderia sp. Ac-20347 TaxID=2703892 RepID=UPI0019803083|nr:hypothetical protein [Paraburkholderia sp. Ac-20347]MBN3808770.1 hypothetical protein [Paraburkholderia sp. Ac-20347]
MTAGEERASAGAVVGVESDLVSIEELRNYVVSNTKIISTLGARLAAFQCFLDAVALHLDDETAALVRSVFQCNVENTMALVDDLAMKDKIIASSEYHNALLVQTNEILKKIA